MNFDQLKVFLLGHLAVTLQLLKYLDQFSDFSLKVNVMTLGTSWIRKNKYPSSLEISEPPSSNYFLFKGDYLRKLTIKKEVKLSFT